MHLSLLSQEKQRTIEGLTGFSSPIRSFICEGLFSPKSTSDTNQTPDRLDSPLNEDVNNGEQKIQSGDIRAQPHTENKNRAMHFAKTNIDNTLLEKEKVFKILAGLKYEKLKGTHREFTAVDLKRTYLTSPKYKQITIQEVYWVLDAVHAAKRLHRRSEKNPKNGKTTFWYKLPN